MHHVALAGIDRRTGGFRHVDGDQAIVFGHGALGGADDLLGDAYTLLSTARAIRAAPALAERAAAVVHVPAGRVEDVAAALLDRVGSTALVALGGGRVIDAAKAVAAATGLRGPVAVPTSLSGAEMTGMHRHARGVPADAPRVRARAVVNDPALSASQPVDRLAASSANALGHAVTALTSMRASPIARTVALDAIARFGRAWSGPQPDRDELALAALLAGWAVDRSGLGPHHALSQTAVRVGGLPHADANAALLAHTIGASRERDPDALDQADRVLSGRFETLAETLRERAGIRDLGSLGAADDLLERAVRTAARRPELARVPPNWTAEEIRRIYRAAG